MRVGLSTSVIQRGKTGVAQYVFALVRSLLAWAGEHQFTLFVLEEDLPLFNFANPQMNVVRVPEKFRPPVKNILWHQHWLPPLIREHQLEVLHVPSYRRLLWPHPCALVATIHDLAPFHVTGKYDRLRMFYGRVVARQLARRQDEIIAISHNTARDLEIHFELSRERITVIPNGLNHDEYCPGNPFEARQVVSKRYQVRSPFFLYVARLEHPGKNHLRLIEAFNQFRSDTKLPWQLLLAGSDWHGAEAIHAAIRRSPFAGDIVTPGFVPAKDLPNLYRAADAFVYPSLYEGFGLPPLEAMACGCPVLCSTRGALGEVIGDAALTVDPENIAELKAQLAKLAGDAALRKRLQTAGIKQARHFDWHTTAVGTLNVYDRALARVKAGAVTHAPRTVEAQPKALH